MSDIAIRVQSLGKEYRIGKRAAYGSLRESLTGLFRRSAQQDASSFWALRDVSFDLPCGEVLGLIGRNGAGKSTLLKVLARITEPSRGWAEIRGRVGSLLEVGTGFHPELTGRENIHLSGTILGMRKEEIAVCFDEIVAFAEVGTFLDTQVKHYSSGMFTRLAFAVAAHLSPEVLFVDEVLAVGDVAFQNKCLDRMQTISKSGRTVVFVSHNMESIGKLCTTAIHLESGQMRGMGKPAAIIEQYLAQFQAPLETGSLVFAEERNGFAVRRIDFLELDGRDKPRLSTWDAVRFRITFESPRPLKGGSVVFQLSTVGGMVLSLCSTQPDHSVPVEFKAGLNEIDLVFPRVHLSAGRYLVSAALAIPNAEWLVRTHEAVIEIWPRDVFESGMAPQAQRYVVAHEHHWELR